jgi:antitoxin component of MazEF toxin-antitoxin module
VEELNLKAGDEVEVRVVDSDNLVIERTPAREELIGRIRKIASRCLLVSNLTGKV